MGATRLAVRRSRPGGRAVRPFYDDLSRSLAGSEEATWDAAISLHHEVQARVCRHLTAQAHARAGDFASITLPPDFVVGIFEDRETEEVYDYLLRASTEPSLLARLNVA